MLNCDFALKTYFTPLSSTLFSNLNSYFSFKNFKNAHNF